MSQEMDINATSAAFTVFAIQDLREAILKFAMFDNVGKISGNLVGAVRLVNKSWLQSATKLLWKRKESLIELSLDGYDSLLDANDVNIKELVETFGDCSRLQASCIPLKLQVHLDFFRERNHKRMSDCLTRLGDDIVEMYVCYPRDGGTMPVTFPPFSLPHLRKLSFTFSRWELEKDDCDDGEVFGNNQNGLGLFQTILNANNAVTELIISCTGIDVVPVGFNHLQLPVTISYLNMSAKLKSRDLEVLLINQLPNLSYLAIMVHEVPFQDELLFKILEGFQNSLQTLKIEGFANSGNPNPHPHTLLRFPLMEKINEIDVNCTLCELGPINFTDLQKFLPTLADVKLTRLTKGALEKWTQDSTFKNVEQLSISIVNEEVDDEDEGYYMSPGPITIIQIQQTFPNVRSLSLIFNISELTGLKSLFQEMAQLKTLKIIFCVGEAFMEASSDLIDSAFLGLPVGLVGALKEDLHLLDNGRIVINNGNDPNIRNLLELVALTLETDGCENGMSLISRLLFCYAFMKMTKLQSLDLHDRFKPTLKMEEQWNGDGRFMKYNIV